MKQESYGFNRGSVKGRDYMFTSEELIKIAEHQSKKLNFSFPYSIEEWIKDKNLLMENYHKHTTWSNFFQFDSATSIEDFIKKSDDYGCQCYFSTEHGYPGEWLYCYDICKQTENEQKRIKLNLSKPMRFRYGAEVYWVKDAQKEYTESYIDKQGEQKTRTVRDNKNCHMILIARNYNAIRKLNYIISIANVDGYYYKPRIDLETLYTLSPDDVYITSACIAGWKYSDAEEIWVNIWRHFGSSFFLEYQVHNTEDQKLLNKKIYDLSKKYGIQTIIGLDTHYIDEEDCVKRNNLLIRKGIHYDDEKEWYMDFPDGPTVLKRMEEQGVIPIDEIIYSMMNTHVFLGGCQDIEYNTDFKIPILDEYKGYSYEQRCEVLKKIIDDGYDKEDSNHHSKEREDAIAYEFNEIKDSGTADYFIDNYEFLKLGINKYGGQLTTTSRGSASSYYISKLLGFTTIDRFEAEVPIFPERFITKDRILASHQMPDIDSNVSKQEPFVLAGKELFGEHGCYSLLAVGKLGEKSGFKLYAGVKNIDPGLANDITTSIDQYNEVLKNAETEEDRDQISIEDYIPDQKLLSLFYSSKPYQGIVEQAKCHACGFLVFNGDPAQNDVIGYGDIRYEIGLIRCYSESTGKSTIVANVEGGLLDSYGYVKEDILIVDVVGIINKLYESIGRSVPPVSELRNMVENDMDTWDLYAKGYTCCLNQCENPGTTKKAMKYRPTNIKELSAFIAGIRPGFKSLVDGFLSRIPYTNGEKEIDELLENSFGYMLYQEAVMKIFSYLGISMKESYDTIKKISKKKLVGEALEKLETNLRSHWITNIGNLNNFDAVYTVIKNSARYSFNAPHALSMAFDSLYEAWMKAHYTSKFYEVVLNHYQDKNDKKNKIAELEHEAMTCFGYKIGSYKYGLDNSRFVIDDQTKTIFPSLGSVKGIGLKAVEDLYKISQNGLDDFVDIYLSIKGTQVNNTVFSNLVKIGYFKEFGTVKQLLQQIDTINQYRANGEFKRTLSKKTAQTLGLDEGTIKKYCTDISAKTGKISEKQYKIIDCVGFIKALCKKIPDDEYSFRELIKFQQEILGYIEMYDERFDKRLVVVTKLDTKYSPKFIAYCLKNRKTSEIKVHKTRNFKDKKIITSFKDLPFEDGDILYMKSCEKKLKVRRNSDGTWEEIPGEFSWWLNDYSISNI